MKFHPFGCASLTTRLLFELCACVLYIRLSIQWVIWVFFHYRWIFQRFPARGKVLRDPKWEKDTRIHTDWPGSLRAFSLSVWGAGWYASRSVRFNQPYINADPWPSSFMYHPTLSLFLNLYFSFLSFDSTSLCGMHCRHHTIDLITNGPELKIAVDCFFWGAIQLTCESINPARVWQQFVPYRFGSAWRLFEPWQPFNKSSTVKSVNYKISADGTPNNMAGVRVPLATAHQFSRGSCVIAYDNKNESARNVWEKTRTGHLFIKPSDVLSEFSPGWNLF